MKEKVNRAGFWRQFLDATPGGGLAQGESADSSGIPMPQAEPSVAAVADAWFTPGRFAALLALLILASFPEVVSGRATFFYRDFSLFGYPLAYYHRECFWRGEFPLWTPLSDCGVPFLAQWNTLTL